MMVLKSSLIICLRNVTAELQENTSKHIRVTYLQCLIDWRTSDDKRRPLLGFSELLSRSVNQESRSRFGTYLAQFPWAIGREEPMRKAGIWEELKFLDRKKIPGVDVLPNVVYLKQSPVFLPILALIFNKWFENISTASPEVAYAAT